MLMKQFVNIILKIAGLFIFLSLFFSFFRGAEVHGSSMYPFLKEGDFFIIYRTNDVDYNNIVSAYSTSLNRIICKRVIGLEGDKIDLREGKLYRNDEYIEEPYVKNTDISEVSMIVGEGQVFLMGDNRPVSLDSRQIGCLGVDSIYGKMVFKSPVGVKFLRSTGFCIIIFLVILNVREWFSDFRKFISSIRRKGDKQASTDREQ